MGQPQSTVQASFQETRTEKGHVIRWSPFLCKSCELCVAFCPTGVLSLDKSLTVQPSNPEACTGCRLCEQLCPDFAIEVDRGSRAPARPRSGSTDDRAPERDQLDEEGPEARNLKQAPMTEAPNSKETERPG